MKKTLGAAVIATALMTGPSLAGGNLYLGPTTPYGPAAFAWDGFYAGVIVGAWGGTGGHTGHGGIQFGANFLLDSNLVLGLDARTAVHSDSTLSFDGAGRAGLAFDRFLVFVSAGVGARDTSGYVFGGGGIEYALMDNLTVGGRLEFVNGHAGVGAVRAETSLLFHF